TVGSVDLSQLLTLLRSALFSGPIHSELEKIQELTGRAELRLKWLGTMDDLAEAMSEGKIRLKEVRLRHQKIPIPLMLTEGILSFSPQKIRFDELIGKMGEGPILLSGEISRSSSEKSPHQKLKELSFQAFSSYLDLDLLFPKRESKEPISFGELGQWLSHWVIDGKVMIEQGRYQGLTYQEFKGEFKTKNGRLLFHPLNFRAEGGNFWSAGWIQPIEKGIRFEIKPRISNMEAGPFLRTVLQKGGEERVFITGRIHIDQVELRGEGENFQKVKETLQGSLRVELEEGVIERFNILSKIFSILNVSQLLKGRLPDLKTKGLPYHQISATLSVKDGIASTEDFLIDSDAMKITLIGKVDLGRNLIDAKIGVHPLVTIDMVLSSLPIAGYILTGKNKAFLSYFYEVKGDLDDPKIEAVPLKSIEETFWGIIKRLVETPLRPFKKSPNSKK
ncbi:MAG: AsmA-like C-terminal domain-containing protein, partial [Thermodesulfobacteriota bacterium]